MSLCATWVGPCTDGKFYKDPTWKGNLRPDGSCDWFICLDDDDPPEIVIRLGVSAPDVPWLDRHSGFRDGHRMVLNPKGFTPAQAAWGHMVAVPPPPEEYSEVVSDLRQVSGDRVHYRTDKLRVPTPEEGAGPLPKVAKRPPRGAESHSSPAYPQRRKKR